MGCKTAYHLVLAAVVLLLSLESFSRAVQAPPVRPLEPTERLAQAGDYVQSQLLHQRKHHQTSHQHHHQRHTQHAQQQQQQQQQQNQSRQRYQSSLGNSSSYSLISGPGSSNGGTDHRQPGAATTHYHHHHQHWLSVGRGHQDTPPQHRRHHPRGPQQPQHHPQQQQPLASSWRRTLVVSGDAGTSRSVRGDGAGSAAASRPVTRMLTRSGGGSFEGTRHNASKHICTVYMYRKSLRTPHSMQPCLDPSNCQGQRTYSVPLVKRETCCSGWETTTTVADGCFKPICQTACRNGGKCTAPERCSCPAGFTGKSCELDVNECKEHKPCDQTCYNTEGSYYCTCRDGFMLQADRHSCRKIDETNDIATEARDMENDVDYDSLDIRLKKLEQMISREERRSYSERQELNKKVQYTADAVSVLKSQVARLTQRLYPSVDYGNRVH